jgi:hypothetical protein
VPNGDDDDDQASIRSLLSHIHQLHTPLLEQLRPLPGGLGCEQLLALAKTGVGRGSEGWVDAVLVLVDRGAVLPLLPFHPPPLPLRSNPLGLYNLPVRVRAPSHVKS